MTASTQAQIEAALKAANKVRLGAGDERAQMEAALAAAAEVAHNEWPSDELINNLVASATEEDSRTVAGAAAEVREPSPILFLTKQLANKQRELAATIERCAQVVLSFYACDIKPATLNEIAAAIRALKDRS